MARVRRLKFHMKNQHLINAIIVALPLLVACNSNESGSNDTFTLATGVKIVSISSCIENGDDFRGRITKNKNGYLVSLSEYFSCKKIHQPFLTLPRKNKITLAIVSKEGLLRYANECECHRSIEIEIIGRLERKQILYVVRDNEVIDEFRIP